MALGDHQQRVGAVIVGSHPKAGDNVAHDAFGRLRVSGLTTLFDSKQVHDNQPLFWDDQETSGSGTSSVHSADRASSTIAVSAATAGIRRRQTFRRFNYQPGKSQLILMTFLLGAGGAGINKTVGIGDTNNGLFLYQEDGDVGVCRRSNVTGSPVDEKIPQSEWNIDKMDGTGPSGVIVDWTKVQIFVMDFEWLGVGRVRMGLNIDGITYPVHQFRHANRLGAVYISTPNLPLFYEIENEGAGAADEIEAICASVASEGGEDPVGFTTFISNATTSPIQANAADTKYAAMGVRLKPAFLGLTVNLITVAAIAETNDDFKWELLINPTVTGTFTYSDVANSGVQEAYSTTNPAATVSGGFAIAGGFQEGGGSTGSFRNEINSAVKLGSAIDGTPDEIILAVTPLSNGLDIQCAMQLQELQ